jgi:hypothetical protein
MFASRIAYEVAGRLSDAITLSVRTIFLDAGGTSSDDFLRLWPRCAFRAAALCFAARLTVVSSKSLKLITCALRASALSLILEKKWLQSFRETCSALEIYTAFATFCMQLHISSSTLVSRLIMLCSSVRGSAATSVTSVLAIWSTISRTRARNGSFQNEDYDWRSRDIL